MKLIQLNMWQGRILWQATDFLAAEKPDIVCLQELYSTEQRVPFWDSFSGYEEVQKALPELKYWFFAPLYSYDVNGRKVTGGNAIGSKYPISDEQIVFVHGQYEEVLDPTSNVRNLQTCRLDLGEGKHLSILNHHAYWDPDPMGGPENVVKMRKVKAIADTLPRPMMMCGDMNVVPASETMQVFKGSLEDLTETHHIETTLTVLARAFNNHNIVPCDHILVSDDVHVKDFAAHERIMSDHKALILTFDV